MATSSTRQPKIPGPDHPITVTPTGARVVATVGDTVVVDTTDALTLQEASYPGVQYVPLAAIDPALLVATDTHTYCPFKGEASYFSILVPGGPTITDAIWTYPSPYDAVAPIAGHAAFYADRVQVTVGD